MRRSDQTLLRLVTGYPSSAPASQRCAFIGEQLGLQGPATPDRLFAVGELMPCEQARLSRQQAAAAMQR